jgi:hypothetical protein
MSSEFYDSIRESLSFLEQHSSVPAILIPKIFERGKVSNAKNSSFGCVWIALWLWRR